MGIIIHHTGWLCGLNELIQVKPSEYYLCTMQLLANVISIKEVRCRGKRTNFEVIRLSREIQFSYDFSLFGEGREAWEGAVWKTSFSTGLNFTCLIWVK